MIETKGNNILEFELEYTYNQDKPVNREKIAIGCDWYIKIATIDNDEEIYNYDDYNYNDYYILFKNNNLYLVIVHKQGNQYVSYDNYEIKKLELKNVDLKKLGGKLKS